MSSAPIGPSLASKEMKNSMISYYQYLRSTSNVGYSSEVVVAASVPVDNFQRGDYLDDRDFEDLMKRLGVNDQLRIDDPRDITQVD